MFVAALCRQFIFYCFVLTIQSVTIVLVYRESAWAHNMDVHTHTHKHTIVWTVVVCLIIP